MGVATLNAQSTGVISDVHLREPPGRTSIWNRDPSRSTVL